MAEWSDSEIMRENERSRIYRVLTRVLTFLIGQGGVQLLSVFSGFLLIRWLPVSEYAQFGLAFAFQCIAGNIVDFGFSSTIVTLVGDRRHQPAVVGSYLRSASRYRSRVFFASLPIITAVFFCLGHHRGWHPLNLGLMLCGVAASIWLQGSTMLQSILIMHARLGSLYSAQACAACARIAVVLLLHFFGLLNAVTAVWVGVVALGVTVFIYDVASRGLTITPRLPDPKHSEECLSLAIPQIPAILFYSFQGQIAIAVISLMGATRGIAEVAALGRLAQLFTLFLAFNTVIVEPLLASSPLDRVLTRYSAILLFGACVAGATVVLCACFYKQVLWILGPAYRDLDGAVVWAVAASATNCLAHTVWVMNLARKFVGWSYTGVNVAGMLALQLAFAPVLKLATVEGALQLSLVAAVASLATHLAGGFAGLRRDGAESRPAQLPGFNAEEIGRGRSGTPLIKCDTGAAMRPPNSENTGAFPTGR